jgi:hypothetical protein
MNVLQTVVEVHVNTSATTPLVHFSVLAIKDISYNLIDCHVVRPFNHVPVQVIQMASVELVVYVNVVLDGVALHAPSHSATY